MKPTEIVYGIHAVKMLLQMRPHDVLRLCIQNNRSDQKINEIKKLAESFDIACEFMSSQQLQNQVGEVARHQGIVAHCRMMRAWSENDLLQCIECAKNPVVLLVLDGVQDPHNLGACLRSANAFGVTAVIAPKDRAANVTEVVRKVASGAAEKTPFIAVTNLHRTMEQLKKAGVWFVGLEMDGVMLLSQVDLKKHIAIVLGGEGAGLRRLTKETCDYLASIPMYGSVENLNVSVAAGIALYEMRRQRS